MSVNKNRTLENLPVEASDEVLPAIQQHLQADGRVVVVLDDDPTGTQTAHGVNVLTGWSVEELTAEFETETPVFYILTNSRSLPPDAADNLYREIAVNLLLAKAQTERDFVIVSRSDSTLRGHYPLEVNALLRALGTAYDGVVLIPALPEAGHVTLGDVQYITQDDELIPVAETVFAQDETFGYSTSNLREWVVEKSNGVFTPEQVSSIAVETIRTGGAEAVCEALKALHDGQVCVVNAVSRRDVEVVTLGALQAEAQGKTLLYRTGATFAGLRGGIGERDLLRKGDLKVTEGNRGVVIVGSIAPLATEQLDLLLAKGNVVGIELNAEACLRADTLVAEVQRVVNELNAVLEKDDAVLYTSREPVSGEGLLGTLNIEMRVSAALMSTASRLRIRPRFMVAKGASTSSDVTEKVLKIERAHVLGQVLPGVPVWQLGEEAAYPGMNFVLFPGEVGEKDALVKIVRALRK